MGWPTNPRPANSLIALRNKIDTMFPRRDRKSDGLIGDEAHKKQGSASDHNPWYIKDGVGVVTALDITNDPVLNLHVLSRLIAKNDQVKYIIFNREIFTKSAGWQVFKGDPHLTHLHLSVLPAKCDETEWKLNEEDMTIRNREEGRLLYKLVQHRHDNEISDKEADGLIGKTLSEVFDMWVYGKNNPKDKDEWHLKNYYIRELPQVFSRAQKQLVDPAKLQTVAKELNEALVAINKLGVR